MNSFIVKGNVVWSESNKELKSVENGYLVIKEGIVEGVFSSIPDEYKSFELIDAGNNLVVPGLVDLQLVLVLLPNSCKSSLQHSPS